MTVRRTEQIPVSDGSDLRLVIVEPDSVIRGGIVVFHETGGVTEGVRWVADGLASEGWLAVVPHLYHRDSADYHRADYHRADYRRDGADEVPDQEPRPAERLSIDCVLTCLDTLVGWLSGQGVSNDRIGVAGFGLGGALALIVAARRGLGAAVTVNGIGIMQPVSPTLPALVEAAPELRCPWLGIYGGDDLIPEEEVHKLRDAADSAQVATNLVHLAGGVCRFGTGSSAAVEAWTRILNWFDCHLR